ncbi:MAG: ATP-dependent Clp protease ATP-binding subunit [Myxococcales bacterium]|nr:ATP-dependent Clp protease ATP-binding subunit [Myxococcales bacterium]
MAGVGGAVNGIVAQARHEARRRGHSVSTAHVLLVLMHRERDTGPLLASSGLHEATLLGLLTRDLAESSSSVQRAFERAHKLAASQGVPASGVHLLEAILRDRRAAAARVLEDAGVDVDQLVTVVSEATGLRYRPAFSAAAEPSPPVTPPRAPARVLPPRMSPPASDPRSGQPVAQRQPTDPRPKARRGRPSDFPADPATRNHARIHAIDIVEAASGVHALPASGAGQFELDEALCPTLAQLGRNLTALAASGGIDPVIGREVEVERLLDILARRRGNNPVLVGPAGVGKTSVVEALALRLVAGGDAVRGLEDRLLIELSAGALVSGTGVRGALSERLRVLKEEVARTEGRVILFIDEIHAVIGGGEGPDDLAHELKAALARGELPCVGATTEAEYRKYFERDPALTRRFSAVYVEEPSPELTIAILEGIAPRYEQHHAVAYDPDALRAAVELSVRYLPERRLPDKAIGILDLAAARVRRRGGSVVDDVAVASVVAEEARVPLDRLLLRDSDKLLALERHLSERVVGHTRPLARIADALRKGAAGFRGQRPLSTFLLLGPTGVGKTETAKAISDVFFPGTPMTRVDMSELSEAHAVAKLLGAPPGYLGHEEGGQLTEPVRRRPYQLVLLDEIEKAHPEVLLTMLPMLDEGRLTDARGRTVDFTNTIIVMTSNLGANTASAPSAAPRIGFGGASRDDEAERSVETRAVAAARAALPPELWNRIDEPLWFGALTEPDVREIARRMLVSLAERLMSERHQQLRWDDSAIASLMAAGGFDPSLGARPMKRVVGRLVESPLAEMMLRGDFLAGESVRLRGQGREIQLEREGSECDAAQ